MAVRRLTGLGFLSTACLVAALVIGTSGCPKKPKATPTPAPTPEATPVRDDGSGVGGEGSTQPQALDTAAAGCEMKPVYFELDSSTLSADALAALKQASQCLIANATWRVTIEGNCDERGSTQYNLALGERRARSVVDYLLNAGVPKDRVNSVSFGEEKPVAAGHDEASWAQNRRAEFRVAR